MQMLSAQAIKEFKEIYFKKYGIFLSDKEALQQAGGLMNFYKIILPKPKEINKNAKKI